ncbi:hypothetical protein ACKKBF_B02675 [Auxenochlorella protothecoides x Auxenochlorella symbiontica]
MSASSLPICKVGSIENVDAASPSNSDEEGAPRLGGSREDELDSFPMREEETALPDRTPSPTASPIDAARGHPSLSAPASPPAPPAPIPNTPSKTVLVLSSSGKPVYCWPQEIEGLPGVAATAAGLLAFAGSRGEELRSIRSGRSTIVLLDRPPLALVAVSNQGEPAPVLRMQLSLLHAQLESVLTRSALGVLFRKAPSYDLRRLLGGTEKMLDALVCSWARSPAALLGAYPSLALPQPRRRVLATHLDIALGSTRGHYALLLGPAGVVALAAAPGRPPLTQWEVLLLLNIVGVLGDEEALTPVCLPHADPTALLHAYVRRLGGEGSTAGASPGAGLGPLTLALLVPGAPDRASLAAAATRLAPIGHLAGASPSLAVRDLPSSLGGGPPGTTPLLHYAYRLTGGAQFVASPPVGDGRLQQAIVLAYSQVRAAAYDRGSEAEGPLCGVRVERRPGLALAAVLGKEGELLAAYDALSTCEEVAAHCARLAAWLRAQHASWFS